MFLKIGKDAIGRFNKETTGHESHFVEYFDENGNRRRKFVPNAIFLEIEKMGYLNLGAVRLYKISEDGLSQIPLHDENNLIVYRCIKPTIETLHSYIKSSKNNLSITA